MKKEMTFFSSTHAAAAIAVRHRHARVILRVVPLHGRVDASGVLIVRERVRDAVALPGQLAVVLGGGELAQEC